MFKKTVLISSVVALFTVSAVAKGGFQGVKYGESMQAPSYSTQTTQLTAPTTELTTEQKDELIHMIEEEKLARDVYSYLNELWGDSIFEKVAQAEQKHLDMMNALAQNYGVETPTTIETRGEFSDSEMQDLYNGYIEKGKNSLIDALEVGVTIEEKDISELEGLTEDSQNPQDLTNIYQNLLKGSYNHLKAFNRQLGR